jgi:hypothetical protein
LILIIYLDRSATLIRSRKGAFMRDFIEGMHKIGDALSAVISAQVTKDAQEKIILQNKNK